MVLPLPAPVLTPLFPLPLTLPALAPHGILHLDPLSLR